jgi:hypothetical protein
LVVPSGNPGIPRRGFYFGGEGAVGRGAVFSAIMIVGALVFVELTAGITEASTTRSASSPWLRRCARD